MKKSFILLMSILTMSQTALAAQTTKAENKQTIYGIVKTETKQAYTMDSIYGVYTIPKTKENTGAKYLQISIDNAGTYAYTKDDKILGSSKATEAQKAKYDKSEVRVKTVFVVQDHWNEKAIVAYKGFLYNYSKTTVRVQTEGGDCFLPAKLVGKFKDGDAVTLYIENINKDIAKNRIIKFNIQF